METMLRRFKALAEPTRLRLLRVLRHGAFNGNELVGILGIGQSNASRHLKTLVDAGLVSARREGGWVYFTLGVDEGPKAPISGIGRGERERPAAPGVAGRESSPGASEATEPGSSRKGSFLGFLLEQLGELSTPELERDDAAVTACLDERRARAERFFRGAADTFDQERERIEGPAEHLEQVLAMLPALDGDGSRPRDASSSETLVDLGTGTGPLLEGLSGRATRVVGVDASREMLAVARSNAQRRGLANVEFRLGTLEHLPVRDGEAQTMVANMVLHHVAHPPIALAEIRRGLVDGGRLVVADLAAHSDERYRDRLGDLWLGFDPAQLERWIVEAGFEIESEHETPSAAERPGRIFIRARTTASRSSKSKITSFPEGRTA